MRPWVPCDYCGEPGLMFAAPMDYPVYAEIPDLTEDLSIKTGNACEKHRRLVELRLRERHTPRRAAYAEGRP